MTMKRMLLLLASMAALIALAAPAAAQASNWYLEGEGPGGTDLEVGTPKEHFTDHFNGTLTYTMNTYVVGPCKVYGSIDVWNEEGESRAELMEFGYKEPCTSTVEGTSCSMEVEPTALFPPAWTTEVEQEENWVAFDVWNVYFKNAAPCPFTQWIVINESHPRGSGSPAAYAWWNNETHCLEWEEERAMYDTKERPWHFQNTEVCGAGPKLVLY